MMLKPPKNDEVEITLFGPGFGESLVIHLGGGRWVTIDSCIDSETDQPAALRYFREIGVDPSASVSHVIATHWHDDHVLGLAAVVEACSRATFCCAAALTSDEFLNLVTVFNTRPIALNTGLSEIEKILFLLKDRKKQPHYVLGDMPIVTLPAFDTFPEAKVTALSPVNAEWIRFIRSLGKYVPNPSATKHRFPRPDENDISIAALVVVGNVVALLGADLETTSDKNRGWDAVLASTNRPRDVASLFKIPHHGSVTGHHPQVWADLLNSEPIAMLTPWNRGSKLPTQMDRKRISSSAKRSFTTSRLSGGDHKAFNSAVVKSIRESNITISSAEPHTGRITARAPILGNGAPTVWSIELSPTASFLSY